MFFFQKLLSIHMDIVILCCDISHYIGFSAFVYCFLMCCAEAAESQVNAAQTSKKLLKAPILPYM